MAVNIHANRRTCPKCGVGPNVDCVTSGGKRTTMHTARFHCPSCGCGREDGPRCRFCHAHIPPSPTPETP